MSRQPTPFGLGETLGGTWDVMWGKAQGLQRIDLSSQGFLNSLWGLTLAVMIDASIYSMRYSSLQFATAGEAPTKTGYVIGSSFIALIAYGVSILALYLLCRTPQEQSRFSMAVIVNNWTSPVISLMVLPIMIVSKMTQPHNAESPESTLWSIISIAFFVAIIFVGTNLLHVSLNISRIKAFGFMAITMSVSILCAGVLEQFMGLSLS